MSYFKIGDSEGGSDMDRIAIVGVTVLAFCWIPMFLVWKCISVMRRKNHDVGGNVPVTTNNSDPVKHPYHPPAEIQYPEPTVPTAQDSRRQVSRKQSPILQ